MPFLLGPRSCIGHHFALEELTQTLVMILNRFNIDSVNPPKPILSTAFTTMPKQPVLFELTEKS